MMMLAAATTMATTMIIIMIIIPNLLFIIHALNCCTNLALICYNKELRYGLISILNKDLNNDHSTVSVKLGELEF